MAGSVLFREKWLSTFCPKSGCPRLVVLSNAKDLLLFFKLGQPFFNYGWLGFV
jgi:hypothetical protein